MCFVEVLYIVPLSFFTDKNILQTSSIYFIKRDDSMFSSIFMFFRFSIILQKHFKCHCVANFGITIKPSVVTDTATEIDVVSITTKGSNDFLNVDSILYFS